MTQPATDLHAALTRSSVLWVTAADGTPRAAWFARAADDEQVCYLIAGAGEQRLPELPDRTSVVLRRRDTRTPVGPVAARAERVPPDDPRWDPAVTALTAARQGVPTEELLQACRSEGVVWEIRLEPGEVSPPAG